MLNRRGFLQAIVKVTSLMPVKATEKLILPDLVLAKYKGGTPFDAGLFYCPYIPLQNVSTIIDPNVGFKTRYGLIVKPFQNSSYYRSK